MIDSRTDHLADPQTRHERDALGDGHYAEFAQGWWARPHDPVDDIQANAIMRP